SKTIKEIAKHPEKTNYIYAARRKVNYDTLENRWLKFILLEYNKFSIDAINYLAGYETELNRLLKSEKYNKNVYQDSLLEVLAKKKMVKKFNGFVSFLLNMKWLMPVKGERPKYFSEILVLDLRYNKLYKLYLSLMNDNYESRLNERFQYYWKRSDLLYEIWGFIRVMKALIKLGYAPIQGWLFDNNSLILPFLTEGTQVRFKKNNEVINLTYNQMLAKTMQQTHINKPLYTKNANNKPDIRLDIIKDDIYSGSLIIDTKYRPLKNIWNSSTSSYAKDAMDQLRNYRYATDSNLYLKGSGVRQSLIERMRPVDEVWAMFPHYGENKITNDPYGEENILLLEHSPNSKLIDLSDELSRFIMNTIK
ncbi:nuclease domain-containing protein, partial [Listeria welshimeri]